MKSDVFKSMSKMNCYVIVSLAAMVTLGAAHNARGQVGLKTFTGTFPDHATYLIEVPEAWNGTLFLYSHGTNMPGTPNPPTDGGDLVRLYLLANGYALAGSSYSSTGWAVQDALRDQIAVLDTFDRLVGHPIRTIAWGHSMGGLITAGLVQKYPDRFSGAVPFCGLVAGSVGVWNEFLDAAFAFNTLLASGQLQVVHIINPITNVLNAETVLNQAQATAKGRARISLAAALADTSGWGGNPLLPEPKPSDYAAQEANQFVSFSGFNFAVFFALRADLEKRARGNPSWNGGVDYDKELKLSVDYAEVQALYQQAGLSLAEDLKTLNDTTRITADPSAVNYLSQNIVFDGDLKVPVLTVHTSGDDIANVQMEQAYAAVVHRVHRDSFLRETFVHRAGHCNFTSAENIAALQAILRRLDTGEWQGTDPRSLNAAASTLPMAYDDIFGPGSQPLLAPAFFEYVPAPFLRPFDALDQGADVNDFTDSIR
jgi:pimeloyl-ACP methyl ester carboxylesterase